SGLVPCANLLHQPRRYVVVRSREPIAKADKHRFAARRGKSPRRRTTFRDFDGLIRYEVLRRITGFERGRVDDRFERRAGLSFRRRDMVVGREGVVTAADPGL